MLLPLATVSHRFHNIILRIIHTRLLLAASLNNSAIIVECYQPASKSTEPYLFCDYLGTPGLSSAKDGEGTACGDSRNVGCLGKLGGLYSHFWPIKPELEHRAFRSHPAGNIPGHPGTSTMHPGQHDMSDSGPDGPASQSVSLDSHELFSQLCVVTNLVQLGPTRGVFYGFANVADGVVRIWRERLAQTVEADSENAEEVPHRFPDEAESSKEQAKVFAIVEEVDAGARSLWVDSRKNVGIRVRIKQRSWKQDVPVLLHADEDPAVSYVMEFEGSPESLRKKSACIGCGFAYKS
ncbi:hypothetical protein MMC11_009134 [Xylographa trunciseda]|nr:hypothetical protein [Xylographa trunciseda]